MADKRHIGWWIGGIVAAVALVAVVIALVASGPKPAPAVTQPPTAPEPTSSPTSSPTVVPSASESPTPSVSRTSVKSKSAYCVAYQTILDTSPTSEPNDEEGGADLKRLSASYATLIKKYSAAQQLAPASLRADYAKVVQYLEDIKATVDTGDWNAVRAQLRLLVQLNGAMDSIQSRSDKICN